VIDVTQERGKDGVERVICRTCGVTLWDERSDPPEGGVPALAAHVFFFHVNSRNKES
jgi:hypothetical protein